MKKRMTVFFYKESLFLFFATMLRKPFLIISNQLISFLLFEQSLSDSQIYSEYKFYSKREFGISKYLNFESMIALDDMSYSAFPVFVFSFDCTDILLRMF